MSDTGPEWRSYERIEPDDLTRLCEIARHDIDQFLARQPNWGKYYANRRLCIALCQGAAQHYVDCRDGKSVEQQAGINDFDAYVFFHEHPQKQWCYRRHTRYDLGYGKFGQTKDDTKRKGRRVDCL